MGRTLIRLKELRDAKVGYISLVDRAASRIPFRVLKRDKEQGMINLNNLGRVFKGEQAAAPEPKVAGIVVMGSEDAEVMAGIEQSLTDAGFTIDKVTKNEDGTVLYAQVDDPTTDSHLVRVSSDMLVVMKGFDAYAEELQANSDFDELVATGGFFSGMNNAVTALGQAIQSELNDGDDPVTTAADIGIILDKFTTYVKSLVAGLPQSAFKADTSISTLLQKTSTIKKEEIMEKELSQKGEIKDIVALLNAAPLGSDGTTWAAMSTVDKIKWIMDSTNSGNASGAQKGDMACPKDVAPEDWAKMSDAEKAAAIAASDKMAKKAEGEAPSHLETLTAMMATLGETLNASVTELKDQVQTLATKVESQQSLIDENARKSETVFNTVNNTVLAAPKAGDLPGSEQVVKSESSDPRSGCFDTAFIARAQKREQRTK